MEHQPVGRRRLGRQFVVDVQHMVVLDLVGQLVERQLMVGQLVVVHVLVGQLVVELVLGIRGVVVVELVMDRVVVDHKLLGMNESTRGFER